MFLLSAGSLSAQISTFLFRRHTASAEAAHSTRKDTVLYLDLSGCNLTAIPEWVYACVNLRTLDLSRNPIVELPRRLNRLKKLYKITCNGAPIQQQRFAPDSLMTEKLKSMSAARQRQASPY